jgi:DNA-directed RNA polymerase subunit RPC12/RpoP
MIANDGVCIRCGYKKLKASIPASIPFHIDENGLWEQCGHAEETGAKSEIRCPKCGAEWEGWAFNKEE